MSKATEEAKQRIIDGEFDKDSKKLKDWKLIRTIWYVRLLTVLSATAKFIGAILMVLFLIVVSRFVWEFIKIVYNY